MTIKKTTPGNYDENKNKEIKKEKEKKRNRLTLHALSWRYH